MHRNTQKFDWITCASIGPEILVTQQEVKNTFRHFKLRNNHHMHPNTTLVAPMTCGPRELSPFLEKETQNRLLYYTKIRFKHSKLDIAQKHKLFLHSNIPDSKSTSYMKLKEKKLHAPLTTNKNGYILQSFPTKQFALAAIAIAGYA